MRKSILTFYLGFVFIELLSCKKDSEVKLPNVDPQIVVSSFISPQDSLIVVAVSLSMPLYNNSNMSNKYSPLLNATVKINNGTTSYRLVYNPKLERYVIDSVQLKITEGITYTLSVATQDGKYADATTKIPKLNNTLLYNTKYDTMNSKYTLQGTWIDNDITNFNNYRFDVIYTSFQIFSGYNASGSFSDTIKTWVINRKLISDLEGSTFKKSLDFTYYVSKKDTVFTRLTTVSKEYYNYYAKFNDAISSFSGPFTEQIQMYTNVRGGLGVFAGFNEYKLRVFP